MANKNNTNQVFVKVNKSAMIFCRAVFAIVLWSALIFRMDYVVLASAVMMFFNAFLTIEYAPLILLYNSIFEEKNPREERVHLAVMQIVHSVMFLVNLVAVIFIFYFDERIGYAIVVFMAIAKSIAALGFCPVSKLTNCSAKGCCVLSKKSKSVK